MTEDERMFEAQNIVDDIQDEQQHKFYRVYILVYSY